MLYIYCIFDVFHLAEQKAVPMKAAGVEEKVFEFTKRLSLWAACHMSRKSFFLGFLFDEGSAPISGETALGRFLTPVFPCSGSSRAVDAGSASLDVCGPGPCELDEGFADIGISCGSLR